MSRLSLRFLGPPRIERDSTPVEPGLRKAVALLAYVAVTGESHGREALVNLLWPEFDHRRGRAALRRTLTALRKALDGDWLDTERETVGLRPDAEVWQDIEQFGSLLAQCLAHGHPASDVCAACIPLLTKAVTLYRGDFMAGFGLRDSVNFDDWQFFQAEALRRELYGALERLVHGHANQGQLELALKYARRWLALDRLSEKAHVQLMQLYAWTGQRAAALRQYEECARALDSQLGVSPQPSTTALYQGILQGNTPQPPAPVPARAEVADSSPAETPTSAAPTGRAQEKHFVTVLYADAGSSLGRSGTSPEAQADLAARFLQAMEDILNAHGGRIYRTLGMSVLALFQAHESAPELAIRAAVEAQHAVASIGLPVKIGVQTGEALFQSIALGDGGAPDLVGPVVDVAVHLAQAALEGQILVGASTYHACRRRFEFAPLSLQVDGLAEPLTVYTVDRPLSQLERAPGRGALHAELVGRDQEYAQLEAAFARIARGQGEMVSLIGEAGVGKSRLVSELRTAALVQDDGPPPLWLEGRCLELGTATSYAPFLDILRTYLAWSDRTTGRRRQERIQSVLGEMASRGDLSEARAAEIGPLLGRLFSLGDDVWEAPLQDEERERLRQRTFLAIRDLIVALARRRPVVLVFEDLHWADDLSLDLLSLLMNVLPRSPLLLVCIYRPGRDHKCSHLGTVAAQKCRERYTEITLRELSQRQSERLVSRLLDVASLPTPVAALVLDRSQGNPLFIEEVVRGLIDVGAIYREGDTWRARGTPELASVPESVQSVILSRLERLDRDLRYVLQIASVIGRVFRRRVLAHATGQQAELERALWELEDRALIYQERTVPEVEYSFNHVLTQETVYRNIVQQRRGELHRQVAESIEDLYGDNLQEYDEELAYHYERGQDVDRAIFYLTRAGEKARRSYANNAAIAHFTRALGLLKTLPASPDRDRRELALQIALGVPLVLTRGHAAPEVAETYGRARELCNQVSEGPQHFQVLVGLRRFYLIRGALRTAREIGDQLLALARNLGDPGQLARAYMMHGEMLYRMGGFGQAQGAFARGLNLYDPPPHSSDALLYGNDTRVGCQVIGAQALWYLGYPDQAIGQAQAGLSRARALAHPFTLVVALRFNAALFQLCRAADRVQDLSAQIIQGSRDGGFALFEAWATLQHGWAVAEQGRADEGIEQMLEGIASYHDVRAEASLADGLAFLAEAYGRVGETGEALRLVGEALAMVHSHEQHEWTAELHRLKGTFLQAIGDDQGAERCFQLAIETARQQRARSWELRAAMSLGRLWRDQGQGRQARDLLRSIYGWFGEGFDTADLQDARALLEALA